MMVCETNSVELPELISASTLNNPPSESPSFGKPRATRNGAGRFYVVRNARWPNSARENWASAEVLVRAASMPTDGANLCRCGVSGTLTLLRLRMRVKSPCPATNPHSPVTTQRHRRASAVPALPWMEAKRPIGTVVVAGNSHRVEASSVSSYPKEAAGFCSRADSRACPVTVINLTRDAWRNESTSLAEGRGQSMPVRSRGTLWPTRIWIATSGRAHRRGSLLSLTA